MAALSPLTTEMIETMIIRLPLLHAREYAYHRTVYSIISKATVLVISQDCANPEIGIELNLLLVYSWLTRSINEGVKVDTARAREWYCQDGYTHAISLVSHCLEHDGSVFFCLTNDSALPTARKLEESYFSDSHALGFHCSDGKLPQSWYMH